MYVWSSFSRSLPGSASPLTHCKGFSRKIPNMNAVSMIKRMIFADGKYQTVLDNRENGKVRRKNFTLYNSNVKFCAQKSAALCEVKLFTEAFKEKATAIKIVRCRIVIWYAPCIENTYYFYKIISFFKYILKWYIMKCKSKYEMG